jgi:beta-mannosidase
MKNWFFLLFAFLQSPSQISAQSQFLHSNWQFKNTKESIWYPATVPGTIHTDLLSNNLIPDPFYGKNETDLQWISLQDWEYQTSFDLNEKSSLGKKIFLQFEGLDTYAAVYLNNQLIRHTANMFRTYHIEINRLLKAKNNTLRIVFFSTEKMADHLANKTKTIYPCENNRHFVRKAQYHFGWDWAPRFITCGIWRNVKLIYKEEEKAPAAQYSNVKLIQQNDSIGQSFYFTVDGKPTFMKGANWIPADVFLPSITKEKYRSLLITAKEAGMNMLRVWGGGIYEDDYFYDLCDSLNIYIWQDFMFAGAMYPGDASSLENIKLEAIDNIIRLRKHKCIVLWCGNNEIDEAWHNWGWQKQFKISKADSTKLWIEYKKIFHEVLPALVKQYDSGRTYIPSSPLYGWGRQQSMTHGDSHYWGMWWGLDSIKIMQRKIPRFMSEYGMQAMPDFESVKLFLLPDAMDTSSSEMKNHQKHPTGFQTLSKYVQMENIPVTDFQTFITGTQELQSRAIATALTAQLNSNGRCMGSLLWQYNDCWPVCSWSIVDYYGRKKKGYETMKKILKTQK